VKLSVERRNEMKGIAVIDLLILALLLGGTVQLAAQEADAKPDTEIGAEQYLLLGTATRGCGESQLAVNPLNHNQMAVSALCQLHQQEGKFEHNELEFERTPRATITEFAITRDRGLTWSVIEDPMRAYFHRYRCLDPFAAFAADGTMLLGCEAHFPTTLSPEEELNEVKGAAQDYGGSAMIWSTDGGRTFSDPVQIISSYMPKEIYGPLSPLPPWDRRVTGLRSESIAPLESSTSTEIVRQQIRRIIKQWSACPRTGGGIGEWYTHLIPQSGRVQELATTSQMA
jgi:hypothetical protein